MPNSIEPRQLDLAVHTAPRNAVYMLGPMKAKCAAADDCEHCADASTTTARTGAQVYRVGMVTGSAMTDANKDSARSRLQAHVQHYREKGLIMHGRTKVREIFLGIFILVFCF